jgi:hypothetical protein
MLTHNGEWPIMPTNKLDYASYLLRLRCVSTSGRRAWTASLQSTATGEDRSFPTVDALAQYLKEQLAEEEQSENSSSLSSSSS